MSDSSGGTKDLVSDMDLSSQTPRQGAGLTQYAADLSDLDPMFPSSVASPEYLISFSPTPTPTPTQSSVTPSKELLMQFDSLMIPSTSSSLQPALIDLDSDPTELYQTSGTGDLTSDSTTADTTQSDTFDTPPSSPSWHMDQTLTPAKLSTSNSSPADSPAILPPAKLSTSNSSPADSPAILPPAPDSPSDTVSTPSVPPRSEPSDCSYQSDTVTAPLPDNDDVMQECAPAAPDNNIVVTECTASPTKTPGAISTSSSDVPHPPLDTSCAHTAGSMLLIHGMEETVSLEKMNLHFSCYRASIHSVELVPDPADSDLKMGVVKFHFPMQAQKLQHEFQQLPISGRTHKITATSCEIPVPLPPLCSPQEMDDLDSRNSVLEGAPIPRERRARPVSPASLEFSPYEGDRSDPQRVPKNRKYQRMDPLPQVDEGRPPVHAVMIKNILKNQNTRHVIQEFAEKSWGDHILSIKPVPDKNSDQHIILYINLHSKGLPEVIAKKLKEERLVDPPMVVEFRYNQPLSSVQRPKCQREVPPTQQEVSPLGAHSPQGYQLPPYHQEGYAPSAPPYPTVGENILLIMEQVAPPVNTNTMQEYFRDYLNDALNWESALVGEYLFRVEVLFSNRRAALHAIDSLTHVTFNGSNVQFSLENPQPPALPPVPSAPPVPAPPHVPAPSSPLPQDPITEFPQAYLFISGIESDVTAEEYERDTFLKRYKEFYSDLRVQTNQNSKEKRIRVSFHSRDAVIEADSALLQCNFRGRKVDVKIQYIEQGETSPKQEHVPSPPLSSQNFAPSNDCKVVVMSIPPNTKESDIIAMFAKFGRIISSVELKQMSQKNNLLQCKVVFDNSESAYNAVKEMDRKTYKGHILDVKVLSELIQTEPIEREVTQTEASPVEPIPHVSQELPLQPPPLLSSQNFAPSNDCKVVVMSIPPNTKESDIYAMFAHFGRIISNVELKPMSQTNNLLQCKVVFDNSESAYNAVKEMDRKTYKGLFLDVKVLSELIQTESIEREVTQTEASPVEPIPHVSQELPLQPPPLLSSQNFAPSNDCKVVVMSIPPNTKESDIYAMFAHFGRIISNVELKPMSQTNNLLQCKVVFGNSESAYNAVKEMDRKTYKGLFLDVKVLSELIQTEPIEREVTQTEASPVEPIPQPICKEVTVELMLYIKTKFEADIETFKSEGTVSYDKERQLLTLCHPDPQALLRFEKNILNEVDEATESLDEGEMKLLNSPDLNFATCLDNICETLKQTKQIDYMMNHYPDQIHIFGEKLSVSIAMKNLKKALYTQLAIECPFMFFFRKFPDVLHKNPEQIELSDLVVRIKSSSIDIEQCKGIKDSMQKVVSSCCYQPLEMNQKYLKPAHVFITRNDLLVCLLIQTSEGKFLDQANKTITGAKCIICGLREHVKSLAPVLDNPIEERLTISQKAMKKLTKSTEKGTILLEKFESRSKVCISLDKQTIIISGFIMDDVKAMVEELQKKFEDVSLVLKEPTLKDLQKLYLLNGQNVDPNLVSQIFQDLECNFQLKVEVQGCQIMLSGDQDSLLNCENNPQQMCEFFQLRLPVKNFHKVVDKALADLFWNLIGIYLHDLSSQECFFIFRILKPQEMTNRPGSSDIQIYITADLSIIALIEPKIKELRPKCEFVKLSKEDLNLVLNAAADKLSRIAKSEYFHVTPDKQACKLRVLSIGISSRSAQAIVDSALCDQNDSRDLPIHALLAFYIREKKLIKSLASQFQCDLKIIEVKENNNSQTCIRIDGKRDSLDKVGSHIASLDKNLASKSVELKFPSKKFCIQFHSEILEVIESMKGESDIIIDTRNITGRDPTSIRESTVKFISTSNPTVHQLSNSFLELIKFEQTAPKPLVEVQHKNLVSDMLHKFMDLCSNRHYYIDLSRENVVIKALSYFAKTAIPCGEQDIQSYLEISACDYRVENLVILNLLRNQPSSEKLNSLGIGNAVNITPPASPDQPFKLEGKSENVQIVLGEIKKYAEELRKYLGKCEVSVHFPLEVLQSDPEVTRFLSELCSPEFNFLYEFPKQSLVSARSQDLIACYEHTLNTQILTIELRKGDITKLVVDAIVNAANESLDHCGGVALAISDAGGPVIQQSSTDYVKKHGKVPISSNVMLPPGNLSCHHVIHAVGPIWDANNQTRVMNELGNCVFNICDRANELGCSSVAIPTISAGIFAFPFKLSTSIIIEAITHFFSSKPFYAVEKVILIDIQDQVLSQFQTLCNNQFRHSPSFNIPTKPTVPLRKKASPHTPQLIFEWQENDGSWRPYSEAEHKKIRAAYQANPEGTVKTSRSKYTYTVDFASMVQVNDKTSVQRMIRVTNSTRASQQASAPASPPSSWKDIASEKIQFFGPRDKHELIKKRFNNLVQRLVNKTEFPVTCQMQDLVRIMDSCKTDYVKFEIEESDEGVCKVQIEGYSKEVMESERNITAELLKLLQVQNPVIDPTPNHWETHSPNEICKLVQLPPTSSEYREVVTKFQSTLPKKSIVRVERVQSTWLWTRYQQDKQRIVQKSESGANEMSVYHGTSNNDPVLIYKGTQGFDHRFAGGMWGMASYFAVNASYSDNGYAHTLADGSKQLFSVKICAGDVIDLPSDGKLRLPPLKNQPVTLGQQMQMGHLQMPQPVSMQPPQLLNQPQRPQPPQPFQPPSLPQPTSQGAVAPQFADDRYDTVSGTTSGSKVYMIYENGRAYPEYLITYR